MMKGKVRQISDRVKERIEEKDNKDIAGHGCSGKISPQKIGLHQMLHSHKTQCSAGTDLDEPNDKACASRWTNSD